MNNEDRILYWKKNLKYLIILLIAWFIVSFGLGILLVDYLDGVKRTAEGVVEDPDSLFYRVRLGGFKVGFWIAQQGAIYFFILIIFAYVLLMNRLDKRFKVIEKDINTSDH
jgi:uncharacterized membrane protein